MNGTPLSYVARNKILSTAEAGDQSNGNNTINEDIIVRALIVGAGTVGNTAALESNGHFIASYLNNWATVWLKLNDIFANSAAWTYYKVGKRQRNSRKVYRAFYDHYLGPHNVDHMAYLADKILQHAVYREDQNKNTFERYITI